MENYKGRYIKVLKKNLGGTSSYYNTGDYLKVIEDKGKLCIEVEYAGVLNVRAYNNRINNGDIEIMPVGFTPEFILPENWHVVITKDNYDILSKYFATIHSHSKLYTTGVMGKYSKTGIGMVNNGKLRTFSYDFGQEITLQQFETYVLKTPKQKSSFPILDKFPEEGCCNTTDKVFIDFLIKNFGISDSKTRTRFATAVGWNSKSYWYLVNVNSSSKPQFDISQLEPFYKKESYLDYIARVKKEDEQHQKEKQLILKNVDHEYTEERREKSSSSSTKICGSDIKIRQADPIRGISLRSSKSKIRIGSNNSNY
jgi:hypothetical protein